MRFNNRHTEIGERSDIDIELDAPLLTRKVDMNDKQPSDYVDEARERVSRAEDEYKAKTNKKQRLAIGIAAAFVAVLLLAFVVKSCGS